MYLEDVENKQELFENFFIWLFNDKKIVNKSISLNSEIDLSLCHYYSDPNIYFPNQIKAFFDTKAMQRLSRISQLDLVVNDNPNAYHNRLEHSKGVYNRKLEELFYRFQDLQWKKFIEENNLKLYLIADLIKIAGHDIGHLPFSHAMEIPLFDKRGIHEEIGKRIMLENADINSVLNDISPDLPKVLEEIYNKDILNFKQHDDSSYDNDRLDFLTRDPLYCGTLHYFPTTNYNTVRINADENNVPICNPDNSITESNSGNFFIDVYDFSSLTKIEETLKFHTKQYKELYMSPTIQAYEYGITNFINAFLSDKSNMSNPLKHYLSELKNSKVENLDLNLFLNFDEISLYTELLDIANSDQNPHIRDLATMIIPRMDSFLNIIYSHLKMYNKNQDYTEYDKCFLKKVRNLISNDSDLSIKLRDKNFLKSNIVFLPQDTSSLPKNIQALISSYSYLLQSYKPNKEPIYIKDSTGKIFELSHHPNKSCDWKNSKFLLHSNFVHIPYLRFNGISDELIENLEQTPSYKIDNNSLKNNKITCNMQPLQVGHNMNDKFLEL